MTRQRDAHANMGLSGLVLLWDEPIFGSERPIRLFLQRIGAPLGPSLLWLDHWYSGLVTRALSPFWNEPTKRMPPSFFFVPEEGPFSSGFIIFPYRAGEIQDLVQRIHETMDGLSITPAVLDSESLIPEVKPFIQEISRNLLDTKGVRLYVSDPAAHPATYGCMTFAGVTS